MKGTAISEYLRDFRYKPDLGLFPQDSAKTEIECVAAGDQAVPRYVNEFWTHKQRQASSIHEISYRACFKPQLPRFFIELLTEKGDVVCDPFSGRGTTVIEAGLLGRRIISNDVNPLSQILCRPRFFVPKLGDVEERLSRVPIRDDARANTDLSMFYHPETEAELVSLRQYLLERKEAGDEDDIERWIRMVATNRLTGHSPGFFSVYTLPPNQAVTPESQIRINQKRKQTPPYRDTREIILRKSQSLVRRTTARQRDLLRGIGEEGLFLADDARSTPRVASQSVHLTVTSPPFLDVVQYTDDNWLRCWFNAIEVDQISPRITMSRTMDDWSSVMRAVFQELFRITRPGGWVAFEVGEVRKGTVKLDEHVVPLGLGCGFKCEGIIVNLQEFTKTSNIWGVGNYHRGTNTNRVVLFKKGGKRA